MTENVGAMREITPRRSATNKPTPKSPTQGRARSARRAVEPAAAEPAQPVAAKGRAASGGVRAKAVPLPDQAPELELDLDDMDGLASPSPDEPLVACCRRYLTVGMPINDVLRTFLQDKTIIGICHRQAYRYRLSEAEAAELLHELGILFYRKLLPRLRDPERVWSVCALTAKRLAAGVAGRIREVKLEDMGGTGDTGGRFEVDDHATAVADLLMRESQNDQDLETSVAARIDKARAVEEFARLLQRPPAPATASPGSDELRRSIQFGPPGQPDPRLRDPRYIAPLANLLFDRVAVLPMPPDDQPTQLSSVDRMPRSYGAVLLKIRDELGLTQKDLADALGISESSCAQYMAGTHGMPRDIWEEAVELQEQGAPRRRRLRELFDGQSIKQILDRWMAQIQQVDPALKVTLVLIARISNGNKSTVTRWAKDEQRPPLDRLGEVENSIQRWIDANRR